MRFFVSIILVAVLSFAACLIFPWWSIAIVSFIIAIVIPQRPGISFITAFAGLFILWGALSFFISHNNAHLLAHKISLIILKIDSPYLLILATAITGAIVAGLSSLTGSFLYSKKARL